MINRRHGAALLRHVIVIGANTRNTGYGANFVYLPLLRHKSAGKCDLSPGNLDRTFLSFDRDTAYTNVTRLV